MTIIRLLHLIWFRDRNIRIRIIASCLLTLFIIALTLSVPLVFKEIIARLSSTSLSSDLFYTTLFIGYGAIWAFSHIATSLQSLLWVYIFEQSIRHIRLSLLQHLLSLTMRFHHDRSTGGTAHSIERAQNGLEAIFWGVFSFLIPTIFELVLASIIIGYLYGLIYTALLLIAASFYIVLSIFVADKVSKAREIDNRARAQTSAQFVDSLLTIETIKYFNRQIYEQAQLNTKLHEQERAACRRSVLETKIQIVQMLFMSFILGIITLISGNGVLRGHINIGDFILINGYLLQIILPLNHIGYIIQQVRKGIEDMKVVLSIFDEVPEICEAPDSHTVSFKKPSIIFDQVHFSYALDRPVLHDISFTIEPGQRVAIVGPTGSGKSTIGRLLLRLYDVTSGAIFIQGHNIRDVTLSSLMDTIAIVPQDTHLFDNTIYYNIAYGNMKASQQEVMDAAHLANLDQFITSLSQGYDTLVGERGLKLSGGEKQRIAIARALLKKPAIFVFDEATSSLDMKTEREIQNNLLLISKDTTTVVIAHRLSTIQDADNIIVLHNGRIAQQGTHHSLLQDQGIYQQLWSHQIQHNKQLAHLSL